MQVSDFWYDLPEELIAQHPTEERGGSRLLCLGKDGVVEDRLFPDLMDLLMPGDLLVFNDTRVIPARLFGQKETGGKVEIFIERLLAFDKVLAQVRASKPPRPGSYLYVGANKIRVEGKEDAFYQLTLLNGDWPEVMEAEGHMPLPPYIKREDLSEDLERYQTVYANTPGAVAAPTAGLHFDSDFLSRIEDKGIKTTFVTLHVGAGTFQPVRVENIKNHVMHKEWLEVGQVCVDAVLETQAAGGRVVAVGTTSVRSLETAAGNGVLEAYEGETDLFITPGYKFNVVDALVTNFHLPGSTLLMLVTAFGGYEAVMSAYRHAVASKYRFFSYGDAMWLERPA